MFVSIIWDTDSLTKKLTLKNKKVKLKIGKRSRIKRGLKRG